jgi:beta-glucosidase
MPLDPPELGEKVMPNESTPVFRDPARPLAERVADLVSRMTLAEKISQMVHTAPAIERLGIPAYDWWNECLHGVARSGIATVFPQAIGMAATWDVDLIRHAAEAIGDEARAKHHAAAKAAGGDSAKYYGLTFWTPNINIFRDPRWGRGQETYGEDPYLTSRFGVAFVRALQGDDPRYLKLVATPKHYAVHSGPEAERHRFDAVASPKELWETYLPAFEATVKEGGAVSVMGAYNRTNGEPCCASPTLLGDILRERWGFSGYVVSDCWAISDIYKHHQVVGTAAEAAALAVKNGCDLNCGETYSALLDAVAQGLIDEAAIDVALTRLFEARFRLGMFDPADSVPYAQIPMGVVDSLEHRDLALQVARESIVLLKNDGLLPLRKDLRRIAVIGPNADDALVLRGNYFGTPSAAVTPLEGIRGLVSLETEVEYARGCDVLDADDLGHAEAVALAERADVVIFVGGLSQRLEGEEGQQEGLAPGQRSLGDRTTIELEAAQQALLEKLAATGTPVVLVLLNGGAVAIPWAEGYLPAIVEAWYPGQDGGIALAEVLFGDINPAGRLPVTFYKATADLPDFTDYRMQGRTYRYFEGEPLYAFGHGLSYTTFAYSALRPGAASLPIGEDHGIQVDVTNTGAQAGDEVVQVYLSAVDPGQPAPIRQLVAFRRIHLLAGEVRTVRFDLDAAQFSLVDDTGARAIRPGTFRLSAGGRQPSGQYDPGVCWATVELRGEPVALG